MCMSVLVYVCVCGGVTCQLHSERYIIKLVKTFVVVLESGPWKKSKKYTTTMNIPIKIIFLYIYIMELYYSFRFTGILYTVCTRVQSITYKYFKQFFWKVENDKLLQFSRCVFFFFFGVGGFGNEGQMLWSWSDAVMHISHVSR